MNKISIYIEQEDKLSLLSCRDKEINLRLNKINSILLLDGKDFRFLVNTWSITEVKYFGKDKTNYFYGILLDKDFKSSKAFIMANYSTREGALSFLNGYTLGYKEGKL